MQAAKTAILAKRDLEPAARPPGGVGVNTPTPNPPDRSRPGQVIGGTWIVAYFGRRNL